MFHWCSTVRLNDEPAQQTRYKMAYSVAEAAEQMSVCDAFVRKLVNNGELTAKRLGDRIIILHTDLEQFMLSLPDVRAAA